MKEKGIITEDEFAMLKAKLIKKLFSVLLLGIDSQGGKNFKVTCAGYESEENYVFLETNGQISYIKPANYEISKTRKYRQDIGRIENMGYHAETDIYTCRNGLKLKADHVRHLKSKTGYISKKTIYKCEDCGGCPYKNDCIKGNK